MTISKEKSVTLPVWAVSALISIILSGFATWGIISAKAATLELRASHNEQNIKELRDTKAGKDELNLIFEQLKTIEKKLDQHMTEK